MKYRFVATRVETVEQYIRASDEDDTESKVREGVRNESVTADR